MEKIKVVLEKDQIVFSYYKRTLTEKRQDLMNTNVISNNELTFSEEYIINNIKMVSAFIKELCLNKNINTAVIKNYELSYLIIELLNELTIINTLILFDNHKLEFKLADLLIHSNITNLNCYSTPYYLLEELDKYGIHVETRTEYIYTSNIMIKNQLNQYGKIFYKVALNIYSPLSNDDEQDFETFCHINKYLKTIHLNAYLPDDLNFICNTLHKNKKKNIDIVIHENIKDEKIIRKLKKLKKKYHNWKINLKLAYNDQYIKENMFKQIIINTLKGCGIVSGLIVSLIFGYIIYNNYQSTQNVIKIQDRIDEVIKTDNTVNELDDKNNTSNKINALLTVNPNTVGWLKVNDTNIDYPILQYTDNDFYLNHNFNDDKDYNGWVYADYRNNKEQLDQNNIIYGHNRYYSGVMFGTLKNLLEKDYFNNQDNIYISYNTLNGEYRWKIFSIYKIKTTSDYLKINFKDSLEYLKFVNMLKKRSDIPFETKVPANSKILTLSTCADNYSRLVVHAVLVSEETLD